MMNVCVLLATLAAVALLFSVNGPPGFSRAVARLALGLVVAAVLALLAAACVDPEAVKGCPEAVAPSSCAALAGADLFGRCAQVLPGSAPLVLRRSAPVDLACSSYPPAGGLFVGRFNCPSSPVELWCLR